MDNRRLAQVFEDIAGLLEMRGDSVFTIRAYRRAARTIEKHPTDVEEMVRDGGDLRELPGIGRAISDKITELVETGGLGFFDKLKAEFPDGIVELMRIPGLGPKTTKRLWKELGVTTLSRLERAAQDGSLAALPRIGEKTADNILRSLRFARTMGNSIPIAKALPIANRVASDLRRACPSIARLSIAGSVRRFEETAEVIALACATADARGPLEALVTRHDVAGVLSHGAGQASVVLNGGVRVDLHVVDERRFGSLLQHLTGSPHHDALLRAHAGEMGLALGEYSVADGHGDRVEEYADEEGLYARLGLQYIPPELRVGRNEIDAARRREIPELVEAEELRGDLHVHTDWSDGRDPMEAMLAGAPGSVVFNTWP